MMKRIIPTLLLSLLCPVFGYAHMNSLSYSDIQAKENEIHWEMKFTLLCTLELFAVDMDSDNFLSKEEIRSAWPMMYYYLSNKIKVMAGGRQLRMTLRDITFNVEEDDSYTVFDMAFKLADKDQTPEQILFMCNVQEETDPYHRNLAEIDLGEDAYLFVFNNINYFDTAHIPKHVAKIVKEENPEEGGMADVKAASSTVKSATPPKLQFIVPDEK